MLVRLPLAYPLSYYLIKLYYRLKLIGQLAICDGLYANNV